MGAVGDEMAASTRQGEIGREIRAGRARIGDECRGLGQNLLQGGDDTFGPQGRLAGLGMAHEGLKFAPADIGGDFRPAKAGAFIHARIERCVELVEGKAQIAQKPRLRPGNWRPAPSGRCRNARCASPDPGLPARGWWSSRRGSP